MIQFKTKNVTVFQSALFQTTSTVVQTEDFILVVDPNWLPNEIEEIKQYVERIQGNKPLYLLFTHGDFDHIIGYKAFPNAQVIGSTGFVHHPRKAEKVAMIHNFDNENYITRPHPIAFPKVTIEVMENGQTLVIGKSTLTFYLAPGHTHDGLFTIIEPLGLWITGDYLSDFELPFIYDSAKAYIDTLSQSEQVLRRHSVTLLVPGHGQATKKIEEMKRRITASQDYLNRLINAVKKNDEVRLQGLEKELPFPSNFTRTCHADNVAIIRKEFETKG